MFHRAFEAHRHERPFAPRRRRAVTVADAAPVNLRQPLLEQLVVQHREHADAERVADRKVRPEVAPECDEVTLHYSLVTARRPGVGKQHDVEIVEQLGRGHVRTPVTNANIVCRLLLSTTKTPTQQVKRYSTTSVQQ